MYYFIIAAASAEMDLFFSGFQQNSLSYYITTILF